LKEFLEKLVKALVDYPEDVEISQVEGGRSIILEIKVVPDDMGKVIGKQGRIAQSLRIIVKAAAAKKGKKVMMEILQ